MKELEHAAPRSQPQQAPKRSYDYSPYHRALEYVGIVSFFAMLGLMGREAYLGLMTTYSAQAWWILGAGILGGILAADFISGLFHFLADNFGNEKLPFLGPNVIHPFREHHVLPKKMTEHDFVETNGNNCLICVPVLIFWYFTIPFQASVWGILFATFWVSMNFGVFMTNQIHKWAHIDDPPAWVKSLQAWHLILRPDHHDVHHTPPHKSYYCITTGWLNPPLRAVRFFPLLDTFLRRWTPIERLDS